MAGTLDGRTSTRAITFIDSRVPDLQALIDGAQPGEMVFVLAAGVDGVQQIADILGANNFVGLALFLLSWEWFWETAGGVWENWHNVVGTVATVLSWNFIYRAWKRRHAMSRLKMPMS